MEEEPPIQRSQNVISLTHEVECLTDFREDHVEEFANIMRSRMVNMGAGYSIEDRYTFIPDEMNATLDIILTKSKFPEQFGELKSHKELELEVFLQLLKIIVKSSKKIKFTDQLKEIQFCYNSNKILFSTLS